MSMSLILRSYTGDPRVLDKTFTTKATVNNAEIWGECDRAHPVFIISGIADNIITSSNYVQAWTRRYRIDRIDLLPGQRYRIYCTLDPLATWATQIKACPATAIRSETAGINYTVDTSLPLMQGAEYATTKIVPGTSFSEVGAYHYLLTLK